MNDFHFDSAALYQPLSPDTLADPFPVFQRLQRETPIFWHDELYAWVLSRYHDCRHVLQHPDQITRDRRKLGRHVPDEGMTIQSVDPPEQVALRQAVLRAIWETDIKAACQAACDIFEHRLGAQSAGHSFDFMSEVAAPAAMRFACRLVGVPDMQPESYRSIFLRLTRAMDRTVYAQYHEDGVEATRELNALIDAARPTAPPGSMMQALDAVSQISSMAPAYVRNTISAAFNAGFSTAYSSMGCFLLLGLERPGLAARIVATGQVALGVKELLRFSSPAQLTARFATCDLVLGGTKIRENDPIITVLAAANRDPEAFEHPDELVLDRSPNPHLSFGYGSHRCVGTKPAEEFLAYYLEHLAGWESRLKPAARPSWLETATLRCLDTLPVALDGGSVEDGRGLQGD